MKALTVLTTAAEVAALQKQVDGLRREIGLAKQKRGGIQAAIDSREKTLARLEAQLELMSPAGQSASHVAG